MNNKISRKNIISNLIWRFAERCGAQGVAFIVSIFLARLLEPTDYGVIGLLNVFIAIANVFIDSGFGNSLIQKKDADEVDFSSVFYFSLVFSIILYIVLFFLAPFIATFYEQPILTNLFRVMAVSLLLGAVNSVQKSFVAKNMQFKKFFYSTLFGTILSAFVGIGMAYRGFGAWALVAQHLTNQVFDTLILWFTVKWRPVLKFSLSRMKKMFIYGWKLLCSSLIDAVYNNIYSLIIGKTYTSADLGYYNKGKSFPNLIIGNINSTIDSVLFPVIADSQEDKEKVKGITRRAIKTSTFVIFPAMAGLASVATTLITLILTEKWLPCVPFLQFCCFTYAFWPVHTANLQAIKALGRSDIFLKLEVIKKVIGICILIITIPQGLYVMMIGRCFSAVLSTFINAFPNKKLLNYSYFEQVKDMLPTMLLSIVMCIVVLFVGGFEINLFVKLILQILVGICVYIFGAKLFKLEAFEYVMNLVKKY